MYTEEFLRNAFTKSSQKADTSQSATHDNQSPLGTTTGSIADQLVRGKHQMSLSSIPDPKRKQTRFTFHPNRTNELQDHTQLHKTKARTQLMLTQIKIYLKKKSNKHQKQKKYIKSKKNKKIKYKNGIQNQQKLQQKNSQKN